MSFKSIFMTGCTTGSSDDEDVKTTIIAMEQRALELWNTGNPDGFIELSSDDVVYFDPAFETKLEGKKALEAYYNNMRGKLKVDRYEMIKPIVRSSSGFAVLIYDYEAYRDGKVFRMHCTEVYQSAASNQWKIIHTHWSFVPPHS